MEHLTKALTKSVQVRKHTDAILMGCCLDDVSSSLPNWRRIGGGRGSELRVCGAPPSRNRNPSRPGGDRKGLEVNGGASAAFVLRRIRIISQPLITLKYA